MMETFLVFRCCTLWCVLAMLLLGYRVIITWTCTRQRTGQEDVLEVDCTKGFPPKKTGPGCNSQPTASLVVPGHVVCIRRLSSKFSFCLVQQKCDLIVTKAMSEISISSKMLPNVMLNVEMHERRFSD